MPLLADLKKFALRGSLVDMAIGFTVGAAFTTVAKSLVTDIIMPPIALLMGGADFADMFWVLKPGDGGGPYDTLAAATEDGAITMSYGVFINNLVAFALVTFVMFMVIRTINHVEDKLEAQFGEPPKPGEPTDKKCPFCRTTIPIKASRCPNCTSQLDSPAAANDAEYPPPA
jgi:large conductance mechanosensitive channel